MIRGEHAHAILASRGLGCQRTREEPAAERRVRDDLDAKLASSLEQRDRVVLDVEREGRVFDLQCRDGVHGVRAAEGGGRDLG